MTVWKELGGLSRYLNDPRQVARLNSILIYVFLIGGSLVASYFILSRTGLQLFMMAVVGVFFGLIYILISFSNLMIPFYVWILAVFGFRFLWSIRAPGLPDLYLDRMSLIGLMVVFFLKFFAEKRRFRGPFLLDWLLLGHAIYMLIGIYIRGMEMFHDWTMSIFIPYAAYFFAKNLIKSTQSMRNFLLVLLILAIYYNITSIAEKFSINALIWPKYIISDAMWAGRSNGPFRHAPVFGTIIGMMTPIHLYFLSTINNRPVKILLYISMMMGFAGLYFTYTRGSWLAGFMALVAVAFLSRRHFLKFVLPALVIAPVVAFLFLGIGQDKFMKARVVNEDTLGSRLGTFVTAAKVWRDNPIFGVGFNIYRRVLDNYVEPLDLPIYGVVSVRQFRHNPPHDIYIAYLAENGLVGVLFQGGIYFMILRVFLTKYAWRRQGDYFATYILPIFGGIFVGYLVGGLAIDYKFFSSVGTLFYSCAGIMYGYQREYSLSAEMSLGEDRSHGLSIPSLNEVWRQPTSQAD